MERNNERRRKLSQVYRDALQELVPQVGIPFQNHPGKTSAHLMSIVLPKEVKREEFMGRMKEQGIQTSIHYPPVHTFTSYKDKNDTSLNLLVTEDVANREVTLPLYPTLTENDILTVVNAVSQALSS